MQRKESLVKAAIRIFLTPETPAGGDEVQRMIDVANDSNVENPGQLTVPGGGSQIEDLEQKSDDN